VDKTGQILENIPASIKAVNSHLLPGVVLVDSSTSSYLLSREEDLNSAGQSISIKGLDALKNGTSQKTSMRYRMVT
jgi:hypothetical protein